VDVVIFGVGSSLVVDLEEGLRRAGASIAAAVANVPGEAHLIDRGPLLDRAEVTPEIAALPYLVPLFTPANRHRAVADAEEMGFTTPFSFIDPTVAVPRSLTAEPGLWVNTGAILGGAGSFGRFVLINRGASVGHHARLGEFAAIGPNATLAGEVTMGAGVSVGAGAVVLPRITVLEHAVVGAGAVVTRDVPARTLVVGNPARVVRESLEGFEAEVLPRR
jgi:carbonic anhydrase/acetyltransferase-like protein (isoleucine patch superfamily)